MHVSGTLWATNRVMLFLFVKLMPERSFCAPEASTNDVAALAELVSLVKADTTVGMALSFSTPVPSAIKRYCNTTLPSPTVHSQYAASSPADVPVIKAARSVDASTGSENDVPTVLSAPKELKACNPTVSSPSRITGKVGANTPWEFFVNLSPCWVSPDYPGGKCYYRDSLR